jgi:hypothetical protein
MPKEYVEYKNKETKEIEDFLNKAREQLNKECAGLMPYKADVRFIKEVKP